MSILQICMVIAYLVFSPFIGMFLDGIDRKISARMQSRKGPSLLQPFYDLRKLFSKELLAVNNVQLLLNLCYMIFIAVSGAMLFGGTDILMCLFILSTAEIFLVLGASSDSSPYSNMGASREMIQMMAFEPLTLLIAVGFYLCTDSFRVADIIKSPVSAIVFMPGMFVALVIITTVKLRKSPFDISTSHHAHQEMVKGITTEMSGSMLGIVNIAEYYEIILLFGIFALFFINSVWWSWLIAIAVCCAVFFVETLIDNVCARLKWKITLYGCWLITLIAAGLNLFILMIIM
jgi:formate hydrogenlyase subunit 4